MNWFNLPEHPTDPLVHWTEKDPVAVALKFRDAWDAVHAAGLGSELELLMDAARSAESMSAAEEAAGESM